jgi:hypothetical protein
VIAADPGDILALLDRDDRHHAVVRRLFEEGGETWILPWAILPEVDDLASTRLGEAVSRAFVADLRDGLFTVDGQVHRDLPRAVVLLERYAGLRMGLTDAVVMAQAERHGQR